MVFRAGFIGINKHLDPDIRDLFGARRDATALWALLSDTIPSIEANLLVDKQATIVGIRQLFSETLGAAGSNDTVILSFAGHGTHDHRLVTYDTELVQLEDTTISMDELADYFRASKAKAILCILDCCFSGGAPARVLENSPIPSAASSHMC